MQSNVYTYLVLGGLVTACSAGLKGGMSSRRGGASAGTPSSGENPPGEAHTSDGSGSPGPADGALFFSSPTGLRALSRGQISASLRATLQLASVPPLSSYTETASKTPTFRNALDTVPDSGNLRALDREIATLITSKDLRSLSQAVVACDALGSEACRKSFVLKFAETAWRRPLTPDEQGALQSQCDAIRETPNLSSQAGLAALLRSILFDPRFLYLSEVAAGSPTSPGQVVQLAPWETLSSLSYGLTLGPPTAAMLSRMAHAASSADEIARTADELLGSPLFAGALSDFLRQWTLVYGLENQTKTGVPQWGPSLGLAMSASLEAFVAQVLNEGGGVRELVSKPTLDQNQGFGIYGTAAFLAATSKTAQGSMIVRGVRLYRDALCQNLPSPPPTLDVSPPMALDPTDPAYEEKLALAHGSKIACKGCHSQIDPTGLSLNLLDGLGQPRGRLVDFGALGFAPRISAALSGVTEEIGTESPAALAQSLAASTVYRRCFARNAMRYLVGRPLGEAEVTLADQLADTELTKERSSIQSLFRAIVTHPAFFSRTSSF